MDKNSKNSLYRYEIDGLRAIAVLSVIINHFNKDILPSGYLGVDIFFVISGYVITASLVRRENKSFSNYIISFYERRISISQMKDVEKYIQETIKKWRYYFYS